MAAETTRVSVVGGSTIDEATGRRAVELGRGLADLGVVLVCGGLGGTMEAACRGYREAGGRRSVGILPGADPADANPHVDVPVATGLGHARNALVVLNGDAVVALPGGGGTLSEVGLARATGTPLVAVDAWRSVPGVEVVDSVREALEAVADRLDLARRS